MSNSKIHDFMTSYPSTLTTTWHLSGSRQSGYSRGAVHHNTAQKDITIEVITRMMMTESRARYKVFTSACPSILFFDSIFNVLHHESLLVQNLVRQLLYLSTAFHETWIKVGESNPSNHNISHLLTHLRCVAGVKSSTPVDTSGASNV